jgi:hypothetical protein
MESGAERDLLASRKVKGQQVGMHKGEQDSSEPRSTLVFAVGGDQLDLTGDRATVPAGVLVLDHQLMVDGVSWFTPFGQQGSDLAEIGRPGGAQHQPSRQRLIHLASVPGLRPAVDRIRANVAQSSLALTSDTVQWRRTVGACR